MENVFCWSEIPVTDFERARKFYSKVLDHEIQGMDWGGYKMGMFPWENNVSGAIVKGDGYTPSDKGALVYFTGGNDLNDFLSKVEKAGGKIVQLKTQISPEMGYMGRFMDTEGNLLGVASPK